jgi:peptidoglycan/xylan/chitin deacetylase (PgdA/CDA1 family)
MAAKPKRSQARKRRSSRAESVTPRYRAEGVRTVWFTFDDGPHKTHTEKILKVLEKHKIKATFFVIGKHCALCGEVLKKTAAAGHRIANHTYNHPDLRKLSAAKVKDEIKRTEAIIAPYVKGPKLIRPPYGAHSATVDRVIAELGYRLVIWNVDTVDWNKAYQPTKWVGHGVAQVKARKSSVVLNHDIHRTTADHLDSFITKIKTLGNVRFGAPEDL